MSNASMLSHIESSLKTLSKSERKVAEYVLENAKTIIDQNIAQISNAISVSEPTIIRFCRRLGFTGYKDFKLKLAQTMSQPNHHLLSDITESDTALNIGQKIIDRAISSLSQTRSALNGESLNAAVTALRKATRIEFYGQGGSGIVASDAQQKFFRLGTPAVAYSDPYIHSVSATLLDNTCVVVAVSRSGTSKDLLKSILLAKKAGATTIAITASGSALEAAADITLQIDVKEDSDYYAPIKSRMSQLVLLDTLAIAVALEDEETLTQKLLTANLALNDKHVTETTE
ncbi:MurR/RpiR family transcriptional regulator [Leucothrix sargassi]|nr:MurR/RpiR family transcriptional regulator [Leucothrix sargassi]